MSSDDLNPFFSAWTAPFGIAPFADIRPAHFMPAFERGMAEHKADVEAIVSDGRDTDFDTVIAPLERMGSLLRKVNGVFWNLSGSNTNEELQAIEREISPVLARHYQPFR